MRHKIRQHIGMALLITAGIGMISHFLGFDAAYAETTDLMQDLQSKLNTANIFMNVIYIILRPVLILAGMALDNNMVYGTFLRLDAPLWVIWNIVKNFANFTLGFMVLVEVIKMVFDFKNDDPTSKITGVIKNCIIAGIGIQASWFLLAAIIDISTVATYSIGGLPLSILSTSQEPSIQCLANKKILGVSSTMDFSNSQQNGVANQGFTYYYYIDAQGGRKNYSPCELKDNYVVGRQYGGPDSQTPPPNRNTGTVFTQPNFCILEASKVVRFNGEIAFNTEYQTVNPDMSQSQYAQNLLNGIVGIGSIGGTYTFTGLVEQQKIFDITSPASLDVSDGFGIAPLYAITGNTGGRETFNDTGVLTMKNLLESGKGMMGPLVTLYASILNFAQFNIQTNNGGERVLVIQAVIKTLFALALLVPIFLTGIIMLIRVGILWVVIAFSPFFVLKRSFEESIGEVLNKIPILDYSKQDLIKIIFSPVVIVFAISLCIIFMSLLTGSFGNRGASNVCAPNTQQMYKTTFDVDENIYMTGQSIKYNNLFEISVSQALGNSTGGDARDYIGWILVNLFGIGVVWMILMSALSFSNKLGDTIGVDKWKSGFANTIGSIPFIPVPTSAGMGFVGAKSFADVSSRAMTNIANKASLDGSARQAFEDLAYGNNEDKNKEKENTPSTGTNATLTTDQISQIDKSIQSGSSRDDIIKSNPGVSTTAIDKQIAESIAKLAGVIDTKNTNQKTINSIIENFKVASKTMTTSQIKTIFDDPNSKLKYILAPKLELGKSQNIKFNDKAWGTFTRKENGEISLTDVKEDVATADQGTYEPLDTSIRQNVEDFLKDLEEQIKKNNPANKTKLEDIKKFYPTT